MSGTSTRNLNVEFNLKIDKLKASAQEAAQTMKTTAEAVSTSAHSASQAIDGAARATSDFAHEWALANGKVREAGSSIGQTSGELKGMGVAAEATGTGFRSLAMALGGLAIGAEVIHGMIEIGKGMVDTNREAENLQIGLGTLVMSTSKWVDQSGHAAKGAEAFALSHEKAAKMMAMLNTEAVKTQYTGSQLAEVAQGIGAVYKGLGRSDEELVKFTTGVATAAAALNMPLSQMEKDIRDVLEGKGRQTALAGPMLGLLGGDQGKFEAVMRGGAAGVKELEKALRDLAPAADAHKDSWDGMTSTMEQAKNMFLRMAGDTAFKGIKQGFGSINDELFVTTNGVMKLNPELEALAKALGKVAEAGVRIPTNLVNIASWAKGAGDYVNDRFGIGFSAKGHQPDEVSYRTQVNALKAITGIGFSFNNTLPDETPPPAGPRFTQQGIKESHNTKQLRTEFNKIVTEALEHKISTDEEIKELDALEKTVFDPALKKAIAQKIKTLQDGVDKAAKRSILAAEKGFGHDLGLGYLENNDLLGGMSITQATFNKPFQGMPTVSGGVKLRNLDGSIDTQAPEEVERVLNELKIGTDEDPMVKNMREWAASPAKIDELTRKKLEEQVQHLAEQGVLAAAGMLENFIKTGSGPSGGDLARTAGTLVSGLGPWGVAAGVGLGVVGAGLDRADKDADTLAKASGGQSVSRQDLRNAAVAKSWGGGLFGEFSGFLTDLTGQSKHNDEMANPALKSYDAKTAAQFDHSLEKGAQGARDQAMDALNGWADEQKALGNKSSLSAAEIDREVTARKLLIEQTYLTAKAMENFSQASAKASAYDKVYSLYNKMSGVNAQNGGALTAYELSGELEYVGTGKATANKIVSDRGFDQRLLFSYLGLSRQSAEGTQNADTQALADLVGQRGLGGSSKALKDYFDTVLLPIIEKASSITASAGIGSLSGATPQQLTFQAPQTAVQTYNQTVTVNTYAITGDKASIRALAQILAVEMNTLTSQAA